MSYKLEGRLLEVCTCNVLCPCWVGEDPDGGTCDGTLAWHVDKGSVDSVDVTGRTIVILCHIPGNILKGNWNVRIYVDDQATAAQKDALVNVWTGKLGGPVADLAQLVGRVDAIEQAPITFQVEGVKGTLKVGEAIEAGLEPFKGATGKETALHDSIFTTIPGSPAYVGKASHYRTDAPGFKLNIQNHNAVSGSFRFEY
ncbi:MAG TPA: DUF1326 domain-containing protein [Opitutaceae bacterium]